MKFVMSNEEVHDEAGFLERLSSDLKPFYEPRLPYHNWDEHIEHGLGIIDNLCEQEKAKGNPINSFIAKVAYMGHDAGFPHDLITPDIWKKHGSKEGYSTHIMDVLLQNYGLEESCVRGVQTCIMFTKMGEQLPEDIDEELGNTAKAVRTADLSHIFGPYKDFVIDSFKLMEEAKMYGRKTVLAEFKDRTRFVLTNYLSLGFIPSGAYSIADGVKNIERFGKDSPSRLLKVVGNQANRFASLVKKESA
jgi:predicted metal-dependent HD superfamily phosphohydrolase